MPSVQRGNVRRHGTKWQARYYDENGVRRQRAGFATKSAAWEWLEQQVDEVGRLRRGEPAAVRRRMMPTLQELVDEYVEQHSTEANTIRTLKARLRYAAEVPR